MVQQISINEIEMMAVSMVERNGVRWYPTEYVLGARVRNFLVLVCRGPVLFLKWNSLIDDTRWPQNFFSLKIYHKSYPWHTIRWAVANGMGQRQRIYAALWWIFWDFYWISGKMTWPHCNETMDSNSFDESAIRRLKRKEMHTFWSKIKRNSTKYSARNYISMWLIRVQYSQRWNHTKPLCSSWSVNLKWFQNDSDRWYTQTDDFPSKISNNHRIASHEHWFLLKFLFNTNARTQIRIAMRK